VQWNEEATVLTGFIQLEEERAGGRDASYEGNMNCPSFRELSRTVVLYFWVRPSGIVPLSWKCFYRRYEGKMVFVSCRATENRVYWLGPREKVLGGVFG